MDSAFPSTLQDKLDFGKDHEKSTQNNPSRAYVRDAKAMASPFLSTLQELYFGKDHEKSTQNMASPFLSTLQELYFGKDHKKSTQNNPSRAYVRDAKAMVATPADVKEYPNSYVFIVDMPRIKAGEIKVQLEDGNVLVVSGERRREKEDGDAKAMAATPADVKEYPNSYVSIVDMPRIKAGEIKVQLEDGNVLVVSGERWREKEDGDAKAMAATPADVKEYPNSYVSIVDMPRIKAGEIKVQLEDGNVLVVSGERRREKEDGDAKAMAATPADVKEYPSSYVFIVDMPRIKAGEIKVQLEDGNVLVVSGERRREKEDGVKYVRMERRVGKFMKKFVLPENANVDSIKAVCQDGVLSVTVEKLPPREPKKPKTIEVKVA